jgi:hypothetical protein
MLTQDTTKREMELRLQASKLSIAELNALVYECMDKGNWEDAKVFANIYVRRVKR